MPVLTRKGFAGATAAAMLTDPARAHTYLTRVLRMYNLPLVRAWGMLPRGVLPAELDARVLERVRERKAAAREERRHERNESLVQNLAVVEGAVAKLDLVTNTLSLYSNTN
ncbi:hypothetical protein DFH09DRAFT_1183974 [Mycena vulgaris]|nr:hypothetical protein DFH09DRAFT_1183974 [Mycena vulgaris]